MVIFSHLDGILNAALLLSLTVPDFEIWAITLQQIPFKYDAITFFNCESVLCFQPFFIFNCMTKSPVMLFTCGVFCWTTWNH